MDLRVMSPTSYQTALPRVGLSTIANNVRVKRKIEFNLNRILDICRNAVPQPSDYPWMNTFRADYAHVSS